MPTPDNAKLISLKARVVTLSLEIMGKYALLNEMWERLQHQEQRMEYLYQQLCIDDPPPNISPFNAQVVAFDAIKPIALEDPLHDVEGVDD